MKKRFYRSVFISDVHLCSRDAQTETLHNFLDTIRCDYLYLVGDIIDVWALKKRWHWPKQYNEVIHKLLKRSRKGAKIIYVPGNHDEFFRDFLGVAFGDIEVVRDTIHETADGRRFLVTHGDQFDAAVRLHPWMAKLGDWAYRHLVTINRVVNFARHRMGLPYWSLSGAIKRRVKGAVTFLNNFESYVIKEAHRRQVDGVVCGHIHQPAMREVDGVTYCNTGDWIENCTALVEDEAGNMELLWWHEEMKGRVGRLDGIIRLADATEDMKRTTAA